MAFRFVNLDSQTRKFMVDEVELDIENNRLYFSQRFSSTGRIKYPELLKNAILEGNELTLANDLRTQNCFNFTETRNTKKGLITARIPKNASEVFAEGEFNRFYIRALCRKVINDNTGQLEVYRAKQVLNPRIESEMMIGKIMDPIKLLDDLRTNIGVDTVLGLPSGPNSGLSIRVIK